MKKLIAFLLVVVMVAGLFAGCNTNPDPTKGTNPPATENNKPSNTDPVELDPVTLKWYIPIDEMEGSADVEKAFNARLAELLPNTTVEFTFVGGYDAYFEQWPLLLGGEEEMDIAWLGWGNNLFQDVLDGNVLPLNDLVAQYAPNIQAEQKLWSYDYGCVTLDGELYAIPSIQPNSCQETTQLIISEAIYKYFDVDAILNEAHNNDKCTEKMWDLVEAGMQAAIDDGALTIGDNSWCITSLNLLWLGVRGYVPLHPNGVNNPQLGRMYIDPEADEIEVYEFYEVPEVQAIAARLQTWKEKGWFTEALIAGQAPTDVMSVLSGNGTNKGTWTDLIDEKGIKMSSPHKATGTPNYSLLLDKPGQIYVGTNSFGYDTTLVIPFTAKNPERAMMLINLLRDEVGTPGNDLLNMLCYGFESTSDEAATYGWSNYTAVEKDGQMETDTSVRNGAASKHTIDNWAIGNTFKTMHDGTALTTKATKDYALNYWNDVYPKMRTCAISGMAFDSSEIATEMENIALAFSEFNMRIRYGGGMEDINAAIKKMYDSGMQAAKDALVKQIKDQMG